ncbi:hypothetical protein JTB14_018795 [Gonioctena quinquepunctata]|nr:hypothetical protein JTB14_018795 [Gonioctena quinquepunctata]
MNSKTEIIYKNSIVKLQIDCSTFIGIKKIQAKSHGSKTSNVIHGTHPVVIPYECYVDIPEKSKLPKPKPLKLNDLNVDDLDVVKHKLDSSFKSLDDIIQ